MSARPPLPAADPRLAERPYIPPLLLELAGRVRTAMLSSGITQAMLARRLGVSEKHVSRVLNGHDDGSLPMWDAMLRETARPREDGEMGNRRASPTQDGWPPGYWHAAEDCPEPGWCSGKPHASNHPGGTA